MLDFFNSLFSFIVESIELIFNFIIYLFNLVIWLFCGIVKIIFSILPNTPFDVSSYTFGSEKYFGYLNWLFPIEMILNITFIWCGCMLVYWSYNFIMRWIKLID